MSNEDNRFTARASRYARVGTNVGAVAARYAGQRLLGIEQDRNKSARDLALALGGLKGPIMKVAQLLSTIPEALPEGIRPRACPVAKPGPAYGSSFCSSPYECRTGPRLAEPFRRASSQHPPPPRRSARCIAPSIPMAASLACKLQYPDMQSAVEADLNQLKLVFQLHARMDPGIDTKEIFAEISSRLREELDYDLEARHTSLYASIFADDPLIRVPEVDTRSIDGPPAHHDLA